MKVYIGRNTDRQTDRRKGVHREKNRQVDVKVYIEKNRQADGQT